MTTRIILAVVLLAAPASYAQSTTATYELIFDASWSAATHPDDFPAGPHFSALIGATHTSGVQFWEPGGIASQGIETMAETGAITNLLPEINAAITAGTADQTIIGPGIFSSPDTTSTQFTASPGFPLLSIVTMIAPSPDWFVGVHDIPLTQDNQWIPEIIISLQPYDAGTDSGPTYVSPNADVTPHIPIAEITGFPFENMGSVAPIGTFTIRRVTPQIPACSPGTTTAAVALLVLSITLVAKRLTVAA